MNTPNERFVAYIYESELQWLRSIPFRRANRVVISAFFEHCQPKMNSFHMPIGDMAITLDDVFTLFDISVRGHSVNKHQRITNAWELLINLFGVSSRQTDDELGMVRGTSVRLEWFRLKFSRVMDTDPDKRIQCAARAHFLYLVGCTHFSNKSGIRVSIYYLKLFENLDRVSNFAWGVAKLAYMYRHLFREVEWSRLLDIYRFWSYF